MTTSFTLMKSKDIPAYSGPHAIPGIRFRAARQALGVSAWGMNLLELDPHNTGHPVHNHQADGQEEVYFVVDGVAFLVVDGAETRVERGDFVRVPPAVTRQFITKEQGVVMLAMGGTPGKAFTPTL